MKLFKSFLIFAAIFPMATFAATQGTLGTTSTGTVNITLATSALLQISGLSDIAITSSTSPNTAHTDACVFANSASGQFQVTATDTAGTAFQLDSQVTPGTNIPFTLAYYNAPGGSGGTGIQTNINYNTPTTVTTTNNIDPTCANITGNKNSSFEIIATGTAIANEVYSTTLTLELTAVP